MAEDTNIIPMATPAKIVEQNLPVVALVGRVNVGKSTLFNALTQAQIAAENLKKAEAEKLKVEKELAARQSRIDFLRAEVERTRLASDESRANADKLAEKARLAEAAADNADAKARLAKAMLAEAAAKLSGLPL